MACKIKDLESRLQQREIAIETLQGDCDMWKRKLDQMVTKDKKTQDTVKYEREQKKTAKKITQDVLKLLWGGETSESLSEHALNIYPPKCIRDLRFPPKMRGGQHLEAQVFRKLCDTAESDPQLEEWISRMTDIDPCAFNSPLRDVGQCWYYSHVRRHVLDALVNVATMGFAMAPWPTFSKKHGNGGGENGGAPRYKDSLWFYAHDTPQGRCVSVGDKEDVAIVVDKLSNCLKQYQVSPITSGEEGDVWKIRRLATVCALVLDNMQKEQKLLQQDVRTKVWTHFLKCGGLEF